MALDGNSITGSITAGIGNLSGPAVIVASNNRLSGPIPAEFSLPLEVFTWNARISAPPTTRSSSSGWIRFPRPAARIADFRRELKVAGGFGVRPACRAYGRVDGVARVELE